MGDNYQESFSRNIGIFTAQEQDRIKNSTIAIAGAGGVGGLLVERLIRIGVGKVKFTDLGTFEKSNLNRQYGSSMRTLEKYKAETVFEEIKSINPEAKIYFDNKGITSQTDAIKFVEDADLVIDEMDYGAWKESIYLQRAARRRSIYYFFTSAIAFGTLLANFDPQGITLEEYNELSPDQDLARINDISVPMERILPIIPSYISTALSMEMLQEIIAGQRPVPSCSIGVGLTSILAASNAINILLNRKEIVKAPNYTYVDLLDQVFVNGNIFETAIKG